MSRSTQCHPGSFAPAPGLQGLALQLHYQAHLDIWLPAMGDREQQQHRHYTARTIENPANYHWGTKAPKLYLHPNRLARGLTRAFSRSRPQRNDLPTQQ